MKSSCVQKQEELMNLVDTRVVPEGAGNWTVEFVGDDGESVSVKVADEAGRNEDEIVEHAKQIMVELTPFGTRGGGASANSYDRLSNGNFDLDEPSNSNHH